MTTNYDARVYVGNLPPDVREKEVEDLFWKYGYIKHVTLKNQRGPPFAFVEFYDYRDAKAAVKGRSGYNYDGYILRAEHPKSNPVSSRRVPLNSDNQNTSISKRTSYRVLVTGIPASGSWQDLKDHMREAGDVCFAEITKIGYGVVEYYNEDDARYAARTLNNSKFKSHENETSFVHVRIEEVNRSRSRSPVRAC